ncbi:fluoride efflux transporter CrcB [Bowmanella sp. JS7-9]|uniref:Fluoride-specific ion channel FluC n=1 Tax=Pseudobowmanella zhangzhouensis TaxID=1537679 RepID=A0ABW1XJF6_9ALTE|nr:fluoride efflux transporter CrcB [Bowmanella sp. JS7-9]TBX26004.1 camphor resistance protein CrcB [Bowmanella sp. JS7-9]
MSPSMTYLYIAIGGASGACLRFFVNQIAITWFGKGFPFGTLIVNIAGSFLLGLIYALIEQGQVAVGPWRSLLAIGFLGALTTFSTFSMDTLLLMQQGHWVKSGLNVALNLGCCLLAAWLGMQMIAHK